MWRLQQVHLGQQKEMNQSLDFRRSLYYAEVAQVLTPFILLLPAWRKKAISNLSQITAAENWHLTCISPHVPLPPHNPLFEALSAISTRTNWNFWWWRSKDLANNPIKKQGKNVYLKYFSSLLQPQLLHLLVLLQQKLLIHLLQLIFLQLHLQLLQSGKLKSIFELLRLI